MHVEMTPERLTARQRQMRRGLRFLFEDNHVLAVAKPPGLLSQAGPKGHVALPDLLDTYRREAEGKPGKAYVGLVHRLDRNVSGVMVVAKTSKAAGRLAALFRERDPRLVKTYLAWVQRTPHDDAAVLRHRLRREGGVTKLAAPGDTDGRDAELRYTVEARSHVGGRLRVELGTGLPHQIRCQLAFVGHPLIGDEKYGGPSAKRPALHALELRFPHPVGGAEVVVGAPVPDDLRRIDARLHLDPPVA